jgi:hypothetical protein
LNPSIRNGRWTEGEKQRFIESHRKYGNKWGKIAREFKGRTYDNVKNFFRSNIRKLCTSIHKCKLIASTSNEIERTLYFLSYISKLYSPHQKDSKNSLRDKFLIKRINSIPLSSLKEYMSMLWKLPVTLCNGALRSRLVSILKNFDLIDSFNVPPLLSIPLSQHRYQKKYNSAL